MLNGLYRWGDTVIDCSAGACSLQKVCLIDAISPRRRLRVARRVRYRRAESLSCPGQRSFRSRGGTRGKTRASGEHQTRANSCRKTRSAFSA
jgi:hypothetical protein